MEWVKSLSGYYRDLAIAMGDDAMEVMFKRGNALVGELESSGFIPAAFLHHLTRRPQNATKTANALVKAGLWEKVPGGFTVVNWVKVNAEAERIVQKKRRDRERKKRGRGPESAEVSADSSTDTSADIPAPRPGNPLYESKSKREEKKTAAAAAVARDATELPVAIAILRSKLQAHTILAALRFDQLTTDQLTRIEHLIADHGDQRLVDVALKTCRTPPPVSAAAFIGTWEALPPAGQSLALVQQFCDQPGHTSQALTPAGICRSCAAERKAAR